MKTNKYFLNILLLVVILWFPGYANSQSPVKAFFTLKRPEKCWVLQHPFKAPKAFRITQNVQRICDELPYDSILDCDTDGGTRDAFKHTFWMVSLCHEMHWKKALGLGIAHEKANKINFIKHQAEDGALPDSANSLMDMLNNSQGIALYLQNPNLTICEYIDLIKAQIAMGHLWILKKDGDHRFLDCENRLIPDTVAGFRWNAPKCVCPSETKN